MTEYITKELLENGLRDYLCMKKLRVLNFTCTSVVASADSYNSSLQRWIIACSAGETGTLKTIWVIVKCCPPESTDEFEVTNDMKFFVREIQMYTKILPEIRRISGHLGTVSPNYICVQEKPIRIIVMEDLSPLGFKMQDRRLGLDLEHCKLAVKKLAQFHAASILIYEKEPHSFSYFQQALYPGNATITHWIKLGIVEIIKAASTRPGMENIISKLTRVQDNIVEKCKEAAKLNATFNVLNHGDCWTNNIMFQYDKNGDLKDLRLIDYQIGVYTSPAIDLQYFWITSPTLDVRRHHHRAVLDYYYNQLEKTLAILGYDIDKIPSNTEFIKDYHSRSYYGFACAVTVMGLARANSHKDASVGTLLDPELRYEGSFCHDVYNNQTYWDHLEHILRFFDDLKIFDC